MKTQKLKETFTAIFGDGGDICCYFSPGRVNLIGEHTDYNGGYVFPCALDFGTYGVARKRNDRLLRFASTDFDLNVEISLDQLIYKKENDWANYLIGVVDQFQKQGQKLSGFDCLISGNIPNGAGLSSSASIELLMAVILKHLFNCSIDMMDMVKLSQAAENQFVGLNCGIMDQFAVGMGKKDHAMLLNCTSLDYEYVPLILGNYVLVIANTNKRRGLADSKYNERRSECEKAVAMLQTVLPGITCLTDVSAAQFEQNCHAIDDEIVLNRAKHVVYENARVLKAVDCLKKGELTVFGKLMNQSHESLRDLYEVSGFELDTLAEEAWKIDGVLGSRMTGAGFGGCTVSIVQNDCVENFIAAVGKHYEEKTGLKPDFYIAQIGSGAKVLE